MEAQQIIRAYSRYFHDVAIECPYGLDRTAVYHQGYFDKIGDELLASFFEVGFRRNGNVLYSMACRQCRACVPIRLNPSEFCRSKNMQRIWKRNQDLEISIAPLQVSSEKLGLCDKFLEGRYPGRGSQAIDYYSGFFINVMTNTMEITFRKDGRLLGVSIIDVGQDFLSAVYFYHDPDCERRSLGTFNILYLLDLALRLEIKNLYLGYWIEEVAAMNYKSRFKPHYLYREGAWQRVG
ncbi:MAG: arginyltransferase [Desulfobulbaceae bacterium]|nr:arginyltransferase [Desulfobulbaceae bacterium]HIJ77851.1 arginyltransferase [Deltaproteobacteria bacterium]